MNTVHPAQSGTTSLAVVAELIYLAEDEVSIIISFLSARAELPGTMQESTDAWDGKRAKERELQRARDIKWKFVGSHQIDDPLMISDRIALQDFVKRSMCGHRFLVDRFTPTEYEASPNDCQIGLKINAQAQGRKGA